MKISSVTAINFMQYDELTFFPETGVHAIVGKNRSGKSSIYESIYWCIFGETVRNCVDVLKKGSNECRVSIKGNYSGKEFIIARRITSGGTKELKFYVNGKILESGNNTINQSNIDKFLNFNKIQFQSSTMFGHNSFRFINATDSEKKLILEEMINATVYKELSIFCRAQSLELKKIVSNNNVALSIKTNDLSNLEEENKTNSEEFNKEKKIKLESINSSILSVNNKFKKFKSKPVNRQSNIDSINKKIEEIDKEYYHIEELIKNTSSVKNSRCDSCGNKINEKDFNLYKNDLKRKLESTGKIIDEYNRSLVILKEEHKNYEFYVELKNELSELNDEYNNVKNEKEKKSKNLVDKIKILKKEISSYKNEIQKNEKEIEYYDFWSKGFGNNGVISFLTDDFINRLNSFLADISEELTDGQIIIQFSSTYETKKGNVSDKISQVCFLDGEEYNYKNMSNSEKQRADLMVMLSFMDMYNLGIDTIFFDEVFEGLDDESSDMVVKYIQNRMRDKCCYVISHSENTKLSFDSVIKVTRGKNLT